MAGSVWFAFDKQEQEILVDALRALQSVRGQNIDRVISKILDGGNHPDIAVGVYGGQVQWVLGNPFPIRICDYDGDRTDLPDIDERGQECRMWLEPIDNTTV